MSEQEITTSVHEPAKQAPQHCPGGKEQGDAYKLMLEARRTDVLERALSGERNDQIARGTGLSVRAVQTILHKALFRQKRLSEQKEELLVMQEALRLDALMRSIWPKALGLDKSIRGGQERAIEVLIKLSERRCKLLGLDRPEKREVSISGGLDNYNIHELTVEAERLGMPIPKVTQKLIPLPGEQIVPLLSSSGPEHEPIELILTDPDTEPQEDGD